MTSTTTSPQRAHQATNALPDSSYGVSEDHPSRRSVLQATDCPESLGGSLRFLAVLREILRTHKPSWLDDHQGWQQEIGSIEDQIHARNIRHGDAPTDADKRSEIWREIHDCLEQRAKARAMATVRVVVDPLLLRAVLVCSAEHQQVNPSMINALRQLYKLGAHVIGGNKDWRELLLALQGGSDLSRWLAETQPRPVINTFCKNLYSYLKTTVASPVPAIGPCMRIPIKPAIYSDPNPPAIPVQTDRRLRFGITSSD